MEVATPHLSAPSSPEKHLGKHFLSAPTSPRRISDFYHIFGNDVSATSRIVAAVPFDWEEKPGTPKSPKPTNECEDDDDFAFDVKDETETSRILPAEELFDCGKIRPLKPLPYIKLIRSENDECQNRKRFPISDIRGTFSPRKKKEFDHPKKQVLNTENHRSANERGRERFSSLSSSNSRHRGARSVSPYRVSKYPWEEEEQTTELTSESEIISKTPSLSSSSSKSRRKWRLKDFFLFRSASEGRAAERDPLRKYTRFFTRRENAKYSSSFVSAEGSDSGSGLRRKGRVSAHELHYTVNRAASEDLKKKTFLPYKQGILGRLAFNPAVHALANGFGFSRK